MKDRRQTKNMRHKNTDFSSDDANETYYLSPWSQAQFMLNIKMSICLMFTLVYDCCS